MPIYTKTGDRGQTSLYGGKRTLKSDIQVDAYGTVDELTSIIGWVCASNITPEDKKLLTAVQTDLYTAMAMLSGSKNALIKELSDRIAVFENSIDQLDESLPELTHFVLPQGSEEAARFHVARSVCRRAERSVVAFFSSKKSTSISKKNKDLILQYINRLSDLFFMLARAYSPQDVVVYTK